MESSDIIKDFLSPYVYDTIKQQRLEIRKEDGGIANAAR